MPAEGGAVNQHYVPQVYLKRFVVPGSSMQVHVLEKETGRMFVSNIRNVASERYFYDAPGKQPSERALGELEAAIGPVLDKLVECPWVDSGEQARLDDAEIHLLATFVALMDVRTVTFLQATRDMRNEIEAMLSGAASKMGAGYRSVLPATDEDERAEFTSIMWAAAGAVRRVLPRLHWMLLYSDGESEFVTSDHPLVKQNFTAPAALWMGNLGWTSDGLEAYLPISPKVCLGLLNTTQPLAEVAALTDGDVTKINRLVANFANRFLIAGSEGPLHSLRRDFKAIPGLRGSRLTIGSGVRSEAE